VYQVTFKEYANYNLYLKLHIAPSTNKLNDIFISMKHYHIFIDPAFENIVMHKHDGTFRGPQQAWTVAKTSVTALAKLCDCPFANPFIIPFYYLKKFNELDSFVNELVVSKRKIKNR
jgi:hypothetical protein